MLLFDDPNFILLNCLADKGTVVMMASGAPCELYRRVSEMESAFLLEDFLDQ